MSQLLSRSVRGVLAVGVALSCFACGEPKPANSPDETAPVSTGSVPEPNQVTSPPNGQPTDIPPSNPPPQSLNNAPRGNDVAMPRTATAPSTVALSQAQIAQVTDSANSGEVAQAKIAQTKAKSPLVKKFAAMMIKHHSEAKTAQSKLYKQLDLTPTPSETSATLQADSDKALGKLRDADSASFDATYIEGQIDAHQKVLDTIDTRLLPGATDQALTAELKKMRSTVEGHLAEAKRIQSELGKTSG